LLWEKWGERILRMRAAKVWSLFFIDGLRLVWREEVGEEVNVVMLSI